MFFYDLLPKLVVIHRKIFFVEEGDNMNVRNEVKSYFVSEGVTMQEILSKLQKQYGGVTVSPICRGNYAEKLCDTKKFWNLQMF